MTRRIQRLKCFFMNGYQTILRAAAATAFFMTLLYSAHAQTSARPLLFDVLILEQTSAEETDRILQNRIKRIAAELKRRPQAKTLLIHYRARVRKASYGPWASGQAKSVEVALSNKNGEYINDGKVILLDGGVRDEETIEFWLIPRGADLPAATPEFKREEVVDCPQISAYQIDLNFDKNQPVDLMARLYPESAAVKFNWSVNQGKIIESDHFAKATLDVSGVREDKLIATVEVIGLPPLCDDSQSFVVFIGNTPKLVDRFGRNSNGDIRARLDAFLQDLSKHPDKHGHIYVYGSRGDRGRDTAARIRLVTQQLFYFRKFDRSRVTVTDAGYREEISTELWLVPAGHESPKPSPTTERGFVEQVTPRRPRPRS